MSQPPQHLSLPDHAPSSGLPLANLAARLVTLISLVVSMVIIKSNTTSYKIGSNKYRVQYGYINSYRYMLFSMVVGAAYTLLQNPMAIYYLWRRKRPLKHYRLLQFDFYGDKVISLILATALGAAFGATTDLKKYVNNTEKVDRYDDYRSKLDDFYSMAFIAVVFLLIGFIGAGISSLMSSLALSQQKVTSERAS